MQTPTLRILRIQRLMAGLTQLELSKRTGIPIARISKIERTARIKSNEFEILQRAIRSTQAYKDSLKRIEIIEEHHETIKYIWDARLS